MNQKKLKTILKIYKICNGLRLSELFTDDETQIHYIESQRKIDDKMWLTKTAKRSVIAKPCQSKKKVLYAIFLNSEGPVVQVAIRNSPAYKSQIVRLFLEKEKVHVLSHPPYSTDLFCLQFYFLN